MFNSLKREWGELRKGTPGHRFQDRYKRNRQSRTEQSWARRYLQPAAGVVVLAAGIIFCVMPGPGLPLVFAGGALLASRSRPVAQSMDWLEVTLRKVIGWGLAWWRQATPAARNAVLVSGAVVALGAAYGAYHVVFGR